jgi:multidrug efflux pump subunit AcrB
MTRNHVASNLLMIVLIAGGLAVGSRVKQEVFPEFELDIVTVSVPYPGASPSEVEQGILLAVEEEVRGLDGVERVTSTAVEGNGSVVIELETGTNANKALADVKSGVDRITSIPEEAEEPIVSLVSNRREVITMALYGDQSEVALKELAERIRQDLLLRDHITYVELDGVRSREIAIEISQADARRYGLTIPEVADLVRRSALELPAGGVKTTGGEVLVRTAERRDFGSEFADLPLVVAADGTQVALGDVAEIRDGFEDTDLVAEFDGQPAVLIKAFRSGEETPIEVSDEVRAYIAENENALPPGLAMTVLTDRSEMYRERIDLLMRNARLGLVLVLLVLGLFLNARLAFWVTMGIPISFMGSLLLMPAMDVSINMVSLFAFIITLGIVVDDAIVVGENIFEMRQQGYTRLQAAVRGAQLIAMPVVFSILTTVVAFMPLFLVPGPAGKFFRVIPAIVICVLLISLVESLFVLPAHLGHKGTLGRGLLHFFLYPFSRKVRAEVIDPKSDDDVPPTESKLMRVLNAPQRWFESRLAWFIDHVYKPTLQFATSQRYLTVAIGVALLVATLGFVASGRINFNFMPKVDGDSITARATLPYGSPVEATLQIRDRLLADAEATIEELGGREKVRGVFSVVGKAVNTAMGPGRFSGGAGSHLGTVQVFMVPADQRDHSATDFATRWRERVGDLPGLESLTFRYSTGPGSSTPIEVQLSHPDIETLEEAAQRVAGALAAYQGVRDIDDGFAEGKPQLDLELTDLGRSMGLTATELARQVRGAFFGSEALRQQRGRDEIKVMVRRPEAERESEFDIENMLIRTPDGGEVPLYQAANVTRGFAYTAINRAEGQRVVTVTADTDPGTSPSRVLGDLAGDILPGIMSDYRGMTYTFEGDSRDRTDSLSSLRTNFVLALFVIFALLAIPFRSYIQPVVVMSAIPFGIVGAVGGHVIMGYELSLISIMGIVAVSGIVVNDSLVLVHAANARRDEGMSTVDAIHWAGARRLRPILLTSLTTFFGLAPMILETSVQARFLIPMAISLGYGVMFSTAVILLIVPSLYLIVDDLTSLVFGAREAEPTLEPEGQA